MIAGLNPNKQIILATWRLYSELITSMANLAIDGQAAKAIFHPFSNVFIYTWPKPAPYSTKDRRGFLTWRMSYIRGPTCSKEDEDKNDFWSKNKNAKDLQELAKEAGFSSGWEWCCHQIEQGCVEKGTCEHKCTQDVQGRLRFTTSEVGYAFNINHDDNGLPTGCTNFNDTMDKFYRSTDLGPANCEKQTTIIDKGYTKNPISDIVELYADDNEAWLKDLMKAYKKMSTNKNKKLVANKVHFWTHTCKFQT